MFKLESYSLSDVGLVRKNNEDACGHLTDYKFFALADGMGGHKAGEVASDEAIKYITCSVEEMFVKKMQHFSLAILTEKLRVFFEDTNKWIFHKSSKNKKFEGMGTTLSTLLFYDYSLILGHVGDSRIYRVRNGVLDQLSYDHSLSNALKTLGKEEEAQNFRNILTRAIGTAKFVEPEIDIVSVESGDLYFLCSDGLTDYVTDAEILSHLEDNKTLKEKSQALVSAANAKGGNDNTTIVLIHVDKLIK